MTELKQKLESIQAFPHDKATFHAQLSIACQALKDLKRPSGITIETLWNA